MRMLSKLLAGSAAAAAAVALAAGPALADPPSGVTPKATDIVGVGSDTSQYLYDQFSHDYNATHPSANLYSWDAYNPTTGATGDPIATKSGCATIARPSGSNSGITALEANVADGSNFCIDYARDARPRASSDPVCGTGGICFVTAAGDAITYASRDAASGGTNAPTNLTAAQLTAIYLCQDTNWSQVGGPSAPIHPFLPVTSSGMRTAFLTALGNGTPITPGTCVNSTVQQNEGIDPQLNDINAIVPFSVGHYIAQVYHSAACTNSTCTGSPPCVPGKGQNKYGCNEAGVLTLNKINGTVPTKPWPLPTPPCGGTTGVTCPVINKAFTPAFQNTIYTVVRFASTADSIPAYLEPVFAASTAATPGWICSSTKAKNDIRAYGFLPLPSCGTAS